jgi:hypothetical protein
VRGLSLPLPGVVYLVSGCVLRLNGPSRCIDGAILFGHPVVAGFIFGGDSARGETGEDRARPSNAAALRVRMSE